MSPFINCKVHGFQKHHRVCEHLIEGLLKGLALDMQLMESRRYSSWVCQKCKDEKQEQLRNCRVACDECIKTSQLKFAREIKADDPFEAYENTLTFAEEKTVLELKDALQAEFGFKIVPINDQGISINSLQIKYGAISHPLTIRIFGITEESLQSNILKSIDAFFQHQEKYQRLILFYEKWYWEKDSKGASLKKIPDKDNLLLRRETKFRPKT